MSVSVDLLSYLRCMPVKHGEPYRQAFPLMLDASVSIDLLLLHYMVMNVCESS